MDEEAKIDMLLVTSNDTSVKKICTTKLLVFDHSLYLIRTAFINIIFELAYPVEYKFKSL